MPYLPVVAFILFYLAASVAWSVPLVVAAWYGLASMACFVMYGLDKAAAGKGRRRTAERTLLLVGLAGGWPGAVVARQVFRHKSSKAAYQLPFWASAALNVACFACLGLASARQG
jgi:uncharacterized membrane protein YsdA (DUF1294 family)